MSRSGYSYDVDEAEAALWQANVRRAIRGRRGQALLRDLLAVLDAMPVKALAANTAVSGPPECRACALGAVVLARGIDVSPITYDDPIGEEDDADWTTEWMGDKLGISNVLAREIAHWNDDAGPACETPEGRWQRMRAWVASRIVEVLP